MSKKTNNDNWKKGNKTSDGEETFEREVTLNRYEDPSNNQTKKKKKVKVKIYAKSGKVEFYDNKNTLLLTKESDGQTTQNSPNEAFKYLGVGNDDTQKQLTTELKEARLKVVQNAEEIKDTATLEDLKTKTGYKSKINNIDPPATTETEENTDEPGKEEITPLTEEERDANQKKIEEALTRKDYPTGRLGSGYYRYPITTVPDELGYDFIRITAYEYTAGGKNALRIGKGRPSAKERLVQDSKKLETVLLPMQPNFSESNAVTWGGDNINPAQLIGASAAAAGISFLGNLGQPGNVETLQRSLAGIGQEITDMIQDDVTGPALVAYFAGQAVGANILGRTAGATLNPNLELLFTGPNLRTFNFNFRFTPRSPKEAKEIKEIIRVFKKNMAVQRSMSNLFLLTPNVFTVEYIYNSKGSKAGELHPYLNIFKPMAMTNLNVNYTPDGTYMTYNDGGSLTAYDLQMSFGEIEPIYSDEYSSNDTDVGTFSQHKNMGY